jgi:hypothetical protein
VSPAPISTYSSMQCRPVDSRQLLLRIAGVRRLWPMAASPPHKSRTSVAAMM